MDYKRYKHDTASDFILKFYCQYLEEHDNCLPGEYEGKDIIVKSIFFEEYGCSTYPSTYIRFVYKGQTKRHRGFYEMFVPSEDVLKKLRKEWSEMRKQ